MQQLHNLCFYKFFCQQLSPKNSLSLVNKGRYQNKSVFLFDIVQRGGGGHSLLCLLLLHTLSFRRQFLRRRSSPPPSMPRSWAAPHPPPVPRTRARPWAVTAPPCPSAWPSWSNVPGSVGLDPGAGGAGQVGLPPVAACHAGPVQEGGGWGGEGGGRLRWGCGGASSGRW